MKFYSTVTQIDSTFFLRHHEGEFVMAVEFMMYIVENTFSYTLKNYAFSNLLNMLYMFYGYEDEEYFMKA